jgi:hypothetical protein
MISFDRRTGPSLAAAVRTGLAVSSLPQGEIGLTQLAAERGPAFARSYGLARAGLQSKPAEKEKR